MFKTNMNFTKFLLFNVYADKFGENGHSEKHTFYILAQKT